MKLFKKKYWKWMIAPLSIIATVAVTFAFLLPSNRDEDNRNWDKAFPNEDLYKMSNGQLTTDYTKASGYASEFVPEDGALYHPFSEDSFIYIDGEMIEAKANELTWDKTLPLVFYKDKANGIYTKDKTMAEGYVAGIPEVKPSIDNIEITNVDGGSEYNKIGWTWETTSPGRAPLPGVQSIKPIMHGIEITNMNGGETYDPTLWTWSGSANPDGSSTKWTPKYNGIEISTLHEFTSGTPEMQLNASLAGIDLGPDVTSTGPQNNPWKARIIDYLIENGNLYAQKSNSGNTIIETVGAKPQELEIEISSIPFNGLDTLNNLKTRAKAKVYDAIANVAAFVPENISPAVPATKPANGTAPSGFINEFYKPGSQAIQEDPGIPAVFTPLYLGTPIEKLSVEKNWENNTMPVAPSDEPENFDLNTYNEGSKGEKEKIPFHAPLHPHEKNIGDTINIDGVTYTIVKGIGWDSTKLPEGPYYYSEELFKYTTDHEKARDYKAPIIPPVYEAKHDGSILKYIIDGVEYTYIDK